MNEAPFSLFNVFGNRARHFLGNTAAVVELSLPLSTEEMQKIAKNFNQPATTFLWPFPDSTDWHVRWFAPDAEIELCGHGAMAAVAYLSEKGHDPGIKLVYKAGKIVGHKDANGNCSIETKAIVSSSGQPEEALTDGIHADILEYCINTNKHIVVVKDEQVVKELGPDFQRLKDCKAFGFIVTAPGSEADFVSRTLIPHVQQLEDPATGSSHAILTSFWSKRLGKTKMTAYQLSKRGGMFICELKGDQVVLSGSYECFAQGKLGC